MQGVCTEIIRKSERNSDSVPPSTSSSSEDSSVDPESLSLFSVSENTLSPLENVTPTIMPAVTSSSPINPFVLSSQDSNASQKQNQHWDPLEILPMDRFNAVVDLIFDPSIVQLNHRRAIINCARYVSASIDESFRNSVSVQEPVNLDFFEEFQTQYTIKTDPYLTMVTPINHDGEESELPLKEQVLAGDINSTVIAPPKKLHNYFQVLLWHRCMSDLIRLYNIIQNRHIDTSPSNSQCPKSTIIHMTQSETLYQQEHSQLDLTTNNSDIYPFCCKAHSLVFTAQYPTSFIPYSLRAGLRQMMRIIQAVTLKTNLPITILGQTGSTSTASRRIQCVGSSNRLNFCSGNAQPPSSAPSHHNRSKLIDDELVKRRHQIEEQTRQDNLTKQELLGLCHMACGLFLVDSQSSDGPSTIMSLLRQGTPWNKGVWREGEWQHDFINQQSNISQSLNNYPQNRVSMNDSRDMGRWQKLCVAAIQFLAHEDLAWGGNRANAELSRLRATSNATAWIYFE
ncbi:hypothetical protein BGZ46_003384 [Entomortierella lignicola]|nr:hypothetical protein BGZ46_003384 [Entomortierella lignicola]